MKQCPCGRSTPFALCCEPLLAGRPAPDAESLMRSRYTAFALGDGVYLLESWHPSTQPETIDIDPAVRWLGLEVKDHRVIDEDHAEVEFVARSRRGGGRAERLHERSRFLRDGGRWYYVDGDMKE